MSPINDILSNYRNRRHLLQTMHLPAKPYGGPDFLYMKNHKAACTNILTLAHHPDAQRPRRRCRARDQHGRRP